MKREERNETIRSDARFSKASSKITSSKDYSHLSGRLWVGVFFIVIVILVFLAQLRLISLWQLFSTWCPLLLLGAGLTRLIVRSGSPIVAILLLALGALLQLQRLRILDIDFFSLVLPLALIFGGAAILLSKATQVATASTDKLNLFAVMGGIEIRS